MSLLTARLLITGLVVAGFGLLFWLRYGRRRAASEPPNDGGIAGEAEQVAKLLPAIVVAGLLCRLVFAFLTPGFHGPDEYPHYKYIEYVARQHAFPVQENMWGHSSYDWEYCQPPLYYLLMAPVYLAADAVFHNITVTAYALRLCSVLLWGANVWLAFVLCRRLRIEDALIKSFVLGLVCLLPTYTFVSAVINNDNLLIVLGGAVLCLMAGRRDSFRTAFGLGVVLGLALLTKQSAVLFIPAIAALYGLEAWLKRMSWTSALLHLGVVLGTGLALFLPWAARNYLVYGTFTPEFLFVETKAWPNAFFAVFSVLHNVLKSFWSVSGPGNEVGYPFPLAGMVFMFLCLNWRKETPEESVAEAGELESKGGGSAAVSAPVPTPVLESVPDYLNRAENRSFYTACNLAILVNLVLVFRFGYVLGMGQGRHLFPLLLAIALLFAARWRTFPVKRLEPYSTTAWVAYALGFLLFSMWLLPVVPR